MKITLLAFALLLVIEPSRASDPIILAGGGIAVSNSMTDQKSRAWGIEQETPTYFGIWQFGYLNEGHKPDGEKRDGIYAAILLPYALTDRVRTSFSIGPEFTATTITKPDGHYRDAYCWSLLPFVGITYAVDKHWRAQFRWSHVLFARDNRDADVFMLYLGYTPR